MAERVSNIRSFMFTGPDGVQYRWALGAFGMSLPKVSIFSPPHIVLDAERRDEVGHHR